MMLQHRSFQHRSFLHRSFLHRSFISSTTMFRQQYLSISLDVSSSLHSVVSFFFAFHAAWFFVLAVRVLFVVLPVLLFPRAATLVLTVCLLTRLEIIQMLERHGVVLVYFSLYVRRVVWLLKRRRRRRRRRRKKKWGKW